MSRAGVHDRAWPRRLDSRAHAVFVLAVTVLAGLPTLLVGPWLGSGGPTGASAESVPLPPLGGLHPGPPVRWEPGLGAGMGWTIEIHCLGDLADAGVPFPLNVSVSGNLLPPQRILWSDTLGQLGSGANFSLLSATPANVTVQVTVTPYFGDDIRANRSIEVVPDPGLSVDGPSGTVGVGVPFPVAIRVVAGTGPFALAWSLDPDPLGNRSVVGGDGGYRESVNATRPGVAVLDAEVVDAWGYVQRVAVPLARAYSDPAWAVTLPANTTEVGHPISLSAAISDGAPPFNWSVASSAPAWNASVAAGVLDAPGSVTWSGTFEGPGDVTVDLRLADAVGRTLLAAQTIWVAPRVAVAILPPAGASGSVLAQVVGGVPGYRLVWSVNGSPVRNDTLGAPGTDVLPVANRIPGNSSIAVAVTDLLGVHASAEAVYLPSVPEVVGGPAARSASGRPSGSLLDAASWAVGGVGVTLGLVAFWFSRRRRAPSAESAGDLERRALAVTRRLLNGTEGLERGTLLFLAEEAGVPGSAVGAAVARWIRSGRIRTEEGFEGETVLRWTDPSPDPLKGPEPAWEGDPD